MPTWIMKTGDDNRVSLQVVQINKDEANAWVEAYHRHSEPVVQHKFSLGALADGEFVGVAIVESPKARGNKDGWTCEVTRVCTTGYPNACSFLYGASWRVMRSLGYLRGVTYTKDSETGASVRAAGWVATGFTKGREWHCPSRPRRPAQYELSDRIRWEIRAAAWSANLEPRPTIPVLAESADQLEFAA
jgi:hypothetical protein